MIAYPNIDPVAVSLGPLTVHWYGLMYMIGFAIAWALGRYRAKQPGSGWTTQQVDDVLTYCIAGLIIGARLGYVLFYNFSLFVAHPADIFAIWKGGMSFHGGLIGVVISLFFFARKTGKNFFQVGDFLVPLAPPGLLAGRLGNFINGELWGRFTDLPWGMIFPGGGLYPRHPSQLYEASLEGVTLFCLMWWYTSRPRPTMAPSGLFLFCYGLFRFTVEFARQPDPQLGFIAFDWLTMGQLLCLPMLLAGAALFALAHAKK